MMIVQCSQCNARFRLDSKRVSDRGTLVACSNCGNQFTVHVPESRPAVDPVVITSVDLKRPPAMADADRDLISAKATNNPFDLGQDNLRTAVHKVPEVIRERARMPNMMEEVSTLVEFQAHAPSAAHGSDAAVVDDGDIIAVDDSDFTEVDDEARFAPSQPFVGSSVTAHEPAPMPRELSRAETAVAHIPSLKPEPRPEESAVHRLHAFERAALPTFADAPNAPAGDGPGLKTFVGRVDAATLAAASQGGDLRGGFFADGTSTLPDEPTRSVSIGFGLNTEPADLGDRLVENRRATRNFHGGDSGLDGRTARGTMPVEVTRLVRVMRGLATVALTVVLLALALFASVRSGQLDLAVLRDPALVVRNNDPKGAPGVAPGPVQSVVYPTSRGGSVLVFTGEIINSGPDEVRNLDVIAEVCAADGTVIASARAPVGVLLDVSDLSRLDNPASVRDALAAKTMTGTSVVPAAGRAPYMAVIVPVPRDYRYHTHQVRLAPRAVSETDAPVAPSLAATPAIAPEIAEPIELGGDNDASTMQRKAKLI
ncbi:MAG: zinc-ribbon domain-containing protein, partial [Clostridia bacterium]|nr:zinc-ribbon domain-containing protein [Deltaproteobacteria bacterium]